MLTTDATGYSIILRAHKLAGNAGAGEALNAEDGEDGLEILNGMIDAWSMDRLFVYTVGFASYALTAGQDTYSIGPSANAPFNVPRPNTIINANIIIDSAQNKPRPPLTLWDDDDWASRPIQDTTSIQTIPTALYYSRDYPNGTLRFYLPPMAGLKVDLETWGVLSQFADLTTAFSFPPGYYEAIYQNLALRFCTPEWGINEAPSSIVDLARESRARIESLNMDPPPQLMADAGLQGARQTGLGPRFNAKNPAPQWYR